MAYGIIKVDTIIFDQGGADQNVTVSGIYRAITSGVTVTGTISGAVLIGTTTVSGDTVTGTTVQGTTVQGISGTFTTLTGTTTTGTTANFVSGVFTTRISGTTVTGDTGQFTSGTFVSLTGTTITGTTINAVTVSSTTGTFGSITGTTITGTTINGATVNSTTGNFTSLTGVTVTGTTAQFASGVFITQVSGLTVTGTQSSFTSGNFVTLSGATATFTSGVIASGTAAAPSLSIISDPNTGLYSPGADQLALATAGTGRLFVDATGRIGIGTSAPIQKLTVVGSSNDTIDETAGILKLITGGGNGLLFGTKDSAPYQSYIQSAFVADTSVAQYSLLLNPLGGNVGIGTTSPGVPLEVNGTIYSKVSTSGDAAFGAFNSFASVFLLQQSDKAQIYTGAAQPIVFTNNNTERARIDSSGRLLVGTSTARTDIGSSQTASVQTESTTNGLGYFTAYNQANAFGSVIALAKSRGTSVGSNTIVQSGDQIGGVYFYGADGVDTALAGSIDCYVDGTPGSNDMPGRLVFSTTADGASFPTERMRITSSGNIITTGTFVDPAITGTILEDIYTITDGAAFEVDPGNGSIQLITLGASRTPKATNFTAGESITLMVNDGTAYTLTWTDATWGTGGVIWKGGNAPTLATTGFSVIQFWKVSTQVYGASVGDVA